MVEGKLFKKLIKRKFQESWRTFTRLIIELKGIYHHCCYPSDKMVFTQLFHMCKPN